MKEKLVGKNRGFSTLELMIAFAIISIVLVGVIGANFMAQYWSEVSRTSNEGLYKTKTKIEEVRSLIKDDFYGALSTVRTASNDPTDPSDSSCLAGGLCYYVQSNISDISSCSKYLEVKTDWQIKNYPETQTTLYTNLTNKKEIINLGGDCILDAPDGNWAVNNPQNAGVLNNPISKQYTALDVLHKKIYTTTKTSPSFIIYKTPVSLGSSPTQIGSYDLKVNGFSVKANAVDVEEDLSTGRTYAFVAVATTTKQLAVFDVTDGNNPELKSQISLQNVDQFGSFPEGYKVYIYGQRLYMTVRETTGTEFHIIDISIPTLPTEIGNGFELNRTVNDLIVREQKIGVAVKRLVFIASDSNLKELAVLDVTGDTVTEINSVDLPGIYDGLSLGLVGKKLYFGGFSNPTGSELFVFDVTNPTVSLPILGQAEVGGNVTGIKVSGNYAFIGTSKTGEEFQVWNSDYSSWNPSILNSGRFKYYSFGSLTPLGFDIENDWIYLINQPAINDKIQVLYTTP